MRLLCASNLHLGRSTYGVPDHLGLDTSRFSMTAAWDALVDIARTTPVDAVLIAGDLVDRENHRFEPLGPIERGLTTLARHDIPVIVVAGDEDAETLRTIAEHDASGAFRFLGQDGGWESTTITNDGGEQLIIAGWSAPGRGARSHPLHDLPSDWDRTGPDIVMLHGTSTDDSDSGEVAPVPLQRLGTLPGRLWITGAPISPWVEHLDGTAVLTPGSPSALGPLDTGTHGVWIADLSDSVIDLHQLPVAAVRFDQVSVDLTGASEIDNAESRLIEQLQRTLDHAVSLDGGNHLAACCVHLTITGATTVFGELPARLHDLMQTIDLQQRGVIIAISSITNETQPLIDLATLLERADPVGETARLLDALDHESVASIPSPWQDLVRRSATRLNGVHRSRVFASIAGDGSLPPVGGESERGNPEPDLETARALLRREAWVTLDALVRQRGIDQEGWRG